MGEKVPGEKKKIGLLAQKCYEEKKARGELPVTPFADEMNCDLDRKARPAGRPGLRPSDIIIGTAALIPAAIKIGRNLRGRVSEDREDAA